MSTTKKNVLIIGDSLTIGYTPPVADELADIALVQHAPWDTSDGGAEETAYGVQCLDYWLHSPSGLPYKVSGTRRSRPQGVAVVWEIAIEIAAGDIDLRAPCVRAVIA